MTFEEMPKETEQPKFEPIVDEALSKLSIAGIQEILKFIKSLQLYQLTLEHIDIIKNGDPITIDGKQFFIDNTQEKNITSGPEIANLLSLILKSQPSQKQFIVRKLENIIEDTTQYLKN